MIYTPLKNYQNKTLDKKLHFCSKYRGKHVVLPCLAYILIFYFKKKLHKYKFLVGER